MNGDLDDHVDAAGIGDLTTWPIEVSAKINVAVDDWQESRKVGRLWAGDAALWTGYDESKWLGWLRTFRDRGSRHELDTVSEVASDGAFDDVLVLGMGGASLCSEVLGLSFSDLPGTPRLHVLDSTDPSQIRCCAERLTLDRTLFIVSSKSGTTLETNILLQYFLALVSASMPTGTVAGERFLAITDPGSELERFAIDQKFRRVFHGVPSIGGRYSALSHFGMVPACAMGVDVGRLLARAEDMQDRCTDAKPVRQNPGAMLGLALGVAALEGRDKMTFAASPGLRPFGTWVEQLIAESTGKEGQGIIPIDGEALTSPTSYGDDRLFVYVRDETAPDGVQDEAFLRLRRAGFPVLSISLRDRYDLGGEFFRWEFATAVAGSLLHVNPFDQPDVEGSKEAMRRLTKVCETLGQLPEELPVCFDADTGLSMFADDSNAVAVGAGNFDRRPSLRDAVSAHLGRIESGDYFAILAYLQLSDRHMNVLQKLRHLIRDATGSATCLQFGPRFLHTTGQAYKGGPNSGVFLQITCDDSEDLDVPGQQYTFGVVKAAQARGDLSVLGERGRRAIRIHIQGDVYTGLESLASIVGQSIGQTG